MLIELHWLFICYPFKKNGKHSDWFLKHLLVLLFLNIHRKSLKLRKHRKKDVNFIQSANVFIAVVLTKHFDFPQNLEYFFGYKNPEKLRRIWEILWYYWFYEIIRKEDFTELIENTIPWLPKLNEPIEQLKHFIFAVISKWQISIMKWLQNVSRGIVPL